MVTHLIPKIGILSWVMVVIMEFVDGETKNFNFILKIIIQFEGLLTINVLKENFYTSTRITTKGKKNFNMEKLKHETPQGDGVWPPLDARNDIDDNSGQLVGK